MLRAKSVSELSSPAWTNKELLEEEEEEEDLVEAAKQG